jgi:hypothetical protein
MPNNGVGAREVNDDRNQKLIAQQSARLVAVVCSFAVSQLSDVGHNTSGICGLLAGSMVLELNGNSRWNDLGQLSCMFALSRVAAVIGSAIK